MSYSLSFSPEFFLRDGEPYDSDRGPAEKPNSVWQAIISMPVDEWESMAKEVFNCEGEYLTPETVLEKIQETNTCSDLESPVEVWIDSEGNYRLMVWD